MLTPSNTAPKFKTEPLSEEKRRLMEQTMAHYRGKEFKEVRCPHCSSIIGYAPKDEDNTAYYKCQKCKAQMLLNARYFKTSRNQLTRAAYLKRKYNIDIDDDTL